jgi:Transposase DDE domain group 1
MPKGLRKLIFSADGDGLTRFGGLVLFQAFCKSLGLRRFLQRRVNWPVCGRKYHHVDLFMTHIMTIAGGIGRIENSKSLKHNGLLPSLLGLPEFPHRDTLRTFLINADSNFLYSLQRAHDHVRRWAFQDALKIYGALLDVDTTSLRIFGRQMEGGVLGYVPHYSKQRCYNVRLLTEAVTGLSLAGEFRPGNMLGVVDIIPFLRSGLQKLPSHIAMSRVRLRTDAGFYDGQLVKFIVDKGIGFIVSAKATGRLQSVLHKSRFKDSVGDWQVGEFTYQPLNWEKPIRFVAARKLSALIEPPVTLFIMEEYAYHILATNLKLSARGVWRLYAQRMSQELLIKELKQHYALTRIPSRTLIANQVYLEILLWAYDLITLFRRLCLPEHCGAWSMSTIRRELFVLPAQFVHTQNKNRLRLPKSYPHLDIFTHAYQQAQKIQPLG